jgi:mRNA degradation ribonuclease J1/J2
MIKESESIVSTVVNENIKQNYVDYNKIKMDTRDRLGKYFYKETECKPMIIVVVQEI